MWRAISLIGVAALLLGVTALGQAEETKGTIKKLDTQRREVILKGLIKDSVYELNKDATVWIDGKRAKLSELNADDRAIIDYEKQGDHMMASSVRVLRNAEETRGTVNDVAPDRSEITLKGAVKNTTYELNKGATVFADGRASKLTEIHAGDRVLITHMKQKRGDHYVATDVTVLKRK